MKYYSEITKKVYNTEDELRAAEKAEKDKDATEQKKREKRKADAKEVEAAIKAANEAYDRANTKIDEFIDKYGSFHMTIDDDEADLFKFPHRSLLEELLF